MKAFEKFAFSIVTMFGLMCFAVVVYGSSPDTREVVHQVIEARNALPPANCSMSLADPCTTLWSN